jgi:lysophospholipase L1-like esterase
MNMEMRDPYARIADELSPRAHSERLALYVAMGDSFTAGTGAPPGTAWPDRLAARVRRAHPGLELANLAVGGATSEEVLGQLPRAIELEPDLVTVVCGANDALLSTRPDADAYADNLDAILRGLRLAVPGVRIVTATSPERLEFMPLGPRTRDRVEQGIAAMNARTRRVAAGQGVPCLEVVGHSGLSEPENFCADGLHPSALGHERAADGFAGFIAAAFGIETSEEEET